MKPLISIVFGTRPEAIKLAPVIKKFKESNKFRTRVILTGQHKEMVSSLKVGNQIITSGGILAKIVKVDDDNFITISISEGVAVKVKRDTITEVIVDNKISK